MKSHTKEIALAILVLMLLTELYPVGCLGANDLRYPKETSLSKVDASYLGQSNSDQVGNSLAFLGDVNGDGYDDMLIGETGNDTPQPQVGRASLILGGPSGYKTKTFLSGVGTSIVGTYQDGFGSHVAAAGDVNGDGYADFLVTTDWYGDCEAHTGGGCTFLFLGGPGPWPKEMSSTKANASYLGPGMYTYTGTDVAGVGDVNGDGLDDFLVAADINGYHGYMSGMVYLIFGKRTGWALGNSLNDSDASFYNGAPYAEVGYDISGRGDVNGDGYDDFVIGTVGGQGYLVLGRPSGWTREMNLSTVGISLTGPPKENTGSIVSIVKDVNGDGLDDLLIGAPFATGSGPQSGKMYLVLGRRTGWGSTLNVTTADAVITGEGAYQYLSYGGFASGDVNGDGLGDIIVSSPWYKQSSTLVGKTYILLGRTSGWSTIVNISQAETSFIGDSKGDLSGIALASGGDINGDGLDDVLVGSPGADFYSIASGAAYLIFPYNNSRPGPVLSLKAYSDPDCKNATSTVDFNKTVYFQMDWADGDPLKQETALVRISSSISSLSGIVVNFTETGLATGKYRAQISPRSITDEGKLWLMALVGETITARSLKDPGKFANVTVLGPPIPPLTLKAYSDPDCTIETSTVYFNKTVYFEIRWMDQDPSVKDTAQVRISSSVSFPGGFVVNFTETGIATGIYRGQVSPRPSTDQGKLWLKALPNEMITARSLDDPKKSANVTVLSVPIPTLSIKAYSDPDCSNETSTVYVNQTVYFEINWVDHDPWVLDTAQVRISSSVSSPGGFAVNFTETSPVTGVYRGQVSPRPSTDQGKLWLKALPNETITARSLDDLKKSVNVTVLSVPIPELTLKAYSDPDCSNETSIVDFNQTVYFEINWMDKDPLRKDTVAVRLSSSISFPSGMVVNFTETDLATGVYRGQVSPRPSTDQGKLWLKALPGEIITARSLDDTKRSVNVTVVGLPVLDVWIQNPRLGQLVYSQAKAQGNATGPEGFQVEVNLDGKGWILADGSGSWNYLIKTKNMTNGSHTLQARAKWNGYYSKVKSVTFRVERKKVTVADDFCPLLLVVLFVTIAVSIVAYEQWKNRSNRPELREPSRKGPKKR